MVKVFLFAGMPVGENFLYLVSEKWVTGAGLFLFIFFSAIKTQASQNHRINHSLTT